MSDTPRTDALVDVWNPNIFGLARDLERELSAAESKVDALMREKEELIERAAKLYCSSCNAGLEAFFVEDRWGHKEPSVEGAYYYCLAHPIRALVREQNTNKEDLSDARSTNHPSIEGG